MRCIERQELASTAFRIINSNQMSTHAVDNAANSLLEKISEFKRTNGLSRFLMSVPADNLLRKDLGDAISLISQAESFVDLVKEG